ncbi:MAG TPA: RNA methyltransferase [Salinivirgaceae bacterium]|nr:RNA methyltransferase [Salinivirgaceae bacterium]
MSVVSASEIKFIKSLGVKKYRQEHGLFVVEGEKVVGELLESGFVVRDVFCTEEYSGSVKYDKCRVVTNKQLERLSFFKTPNKVLAVAEIPKDECNIEQFLSQDKLLLLGLDNINDPGNMGTIIRIANWFGIKYIVCSPECVDCYSPKVVQASMGSLFRVNIYYDDLSKVIKNIKKSGEISVYSSNMDGVSVYETVIQNRALLLLGNESHGIRNEISALADYKIKLPSFPAGNSSMESLNVSVAAGVLCAEFRRRQ